MESRLLSHIAFKFTNQPENIANESLCFILNSDEKAVLIMLGIFSKEHLAKDLIEFRTEMSTDANGRPDITGLASNHKKPVIIEGKFWASLTDNQPNNYLNELEDGGCLIFVCPNARASRVKDELQERTGKEFAYVSNSYYSSSVGSKDIYVIDWTQLLTRINDFASTNNKSLSNDIVQLMDLCSIMDSKGFLPLTASDINEYHGRICFQLAEVLDTVRDTLRTRTYTNFDRLKAVAWQSGYGFYFRVHNYGCLLSFSTYKWHKGEISTPYWLRIQTPDWKPDTGLSIHFKSRPKFKALTVCTQENTEIAIPLKTNLDKEELVSYISCFIDDAASVLENLKLTIPISPVLTPLVETSDSPEEVISISP